MGMTKALRPLTTAAFGALVSVGCYSATPLRVEVRSRPPAATCVQTADRVFADAGFERVRTVLGPDMFYTPRTTAGASLSLSWGIGAWLSHDQNNACALTIEAISPDPEVPEMRSLSVQPSASFVASTRDVLRPFSMQRGEPFDAALRDMARRLEIAFERPPGASQ